MYAKSRDVMVLSGTGQYYFMTESEIIEVKQIYRQSQRN